MYWRVACSIFVMLVCSACSSGAALKPAGTPALPAALGTLAGLLPLSALPVPQRFASQIGPGFINLDPQAPLLANGVTNDGTAIVLDGDAAGGGLPAYAIYGVRGFEPGAGPTSASVTFSSVDTKFFVGFADYTAGHWRFIGPLIQSTTVEIPGAGTPDPADYLSPEGYAYFGVFCARGHSVRLTLPALGVQGGTGAPAPVLEAQYTGASWPYVLTWTHSVDFAAPDFDGYFVERAPLLSGGFQRLTTSPTKLNYFIDDMIDPGEQYRMRIAAVDVSGNQSAWFELSGPTDIANPVCILNAPAGPLTAPVEAAFDLSESFDPLGQAITEYRIVLGGGVADVVSSDPLITVTLQPGCYIVRASVTTADARTGWDQRALKAYPQWDEAPVVVRGLTAGDGASYSQLRLAVDPATGYISLCALDSRIPGVSLWRQTSATEIDWAVLPDYGWSRQLEPQASAAGAAQFLLLDANMQLGTASIQGDQQARYDGLVTPGAPQSVFALFHDVDDAPWVVKLGDPGGSFPLDFVTAPLSDLADEKLICEGFDQQHFATVFQQDSGNLEIYCGSATDALEYKPFLAHYALGSQTGSAEAMPADKWYPNSEIIAPADELDLTLAYYDGAHVQTMIYEGGMWQAPVAVDDSVANSSCFDIAYCRGTKCILINTNRPRLYEWDGSAWALRNQPAYATAPAVEVSLANIGSGDQDATAATLSQDGVVQIGVLHQDGSDELLQQWQPSSGAGPLLSAAADASGLHVVARSTPDNVTYHYYSTTGGASFIKLADLPVRDWLDLTATSAGQVHLAARLGTTSLLSFWNAGAFVPAGTVAPGLTPLLSQVGEPQVRFGAFTSTPDNHLELFYGDPGGGFTQTQLPTTVDPVLLGVLSPQLLNPRAFCLGQYDSVLGQYTFAGLISIPDGTQTKLFTPSLPAHLDLASASLRTGPATAAGFFQGGLGQPARQVFWSAFGEGPAPTRAVVQADGSFALASLPGAWNGDLLTGAPLRIVQAAAADGATAVCLAASLLGETVVMEWSAYGAWEQLPVPAGMLGLASYELCVDQDGVWHLLAHDWKNDRIVCFNTVGSAP